MLAQLGLVLRESEYIENTSTSSLKDRILETGLDPESPAVAEALSFIEMANGLLGR